jgi:glycosyltransferase involved in cell wall biosynthesis
MSRLLLDLSHTSHTRAQTGIQRLCRSLYGALQSGPEDVQPVCFDPFESTWRPLRAWERRTLRPPRGVVAGARGARWPLPARLAGRLRRLLAAGRKRGRGPVIAGEGFVEPEIFSPAVGRALPGLLAGITGPRVALFHDATALRLPELSPPKTVARYPSYLQELLQFDGVAAISDDSRAALVEYWRWLQVPHPPPVLGLPLGIDVPEPSPLGHTNAPDAAPVVLSIGSLEGRKNHLALLEACETLWQRGRRFELRLIGLAHPQTGRAALERLRALQVAGRPVHYGGPASEADLQRAYRACVFTVYPSLMEGFGLPVFESLSHGKPCICSAHSALGEAARDGGCVALDRVDAPALAEAIDCLLSDPDRLDGLVDAAQRRAFKTWSAYAGELTAWMHTLPRRGSPP